MIGSPSTESGGGAVSSGLATGDVSNFTSSKVFLYSAYKGGCRVLCRTTVVFDWIPLIKEWNGVWFSGEFVFFDLDFVQAPP